MHRAFRGALMHVGRHVLFVTIAVAAVIAFVSIAGGTSAQTGQQITIVPIQAGTTSASAPTTSAVSSIVETPPPAPARPPAAAPSKATTKASTLAPPTSAAVPVNPRPTPSYHYSHAAKSPRSPAFHFAGSRNIAALINPARESQGFADVTTAALRSDAGCINDSAQPCAGQIGPCGETPNSIGTAETSRVYDGQYKDQDGNCLEVIVI
jgi:hypothetical protein